MNINSIRNQFSALCDILKKAPLDILCVDETKLDDSFPDSQFKVDGYQFPPFRRDRNAKGGGKIVFIRNGLIVKRLQTFETKTAETICLELTINKKKWCVLFVYRQPRMAKNLFFEEMSKSLSQIINKYDNILIEGDFNIDISKSNDENTSYLSDLRDTFNLTNLVKEPTCFKSLKGFYHEKLSFDILLKSIQDVQNNLRFLLKVFCFEETQENSVIFLQ